MVHGHATADRRTDTQTDAPRAWPLYISRRLRLTPNLISTAGVYRQHFWMWCPDQFWRLKGKTEFKFLLQLLRSSWNFPYTIYAYYNCVLYSLYSDSVLDKTVPGLVVLARPDSSGYAHCKYWCIQEAYCHNMPNKFLKNNKTRD